MTTIFKIVNKTHMHAGSGDSNFGVIDKLIQRDPTDHLPCIYASSLKGACREYWEQYQKNKTEAELIFGKDDKGALIFHQAHLLSIPQRSNKLPYFNVSAKSAIDNLIYSMELCGNTYNPILEKLRLIVAPNLGQIHVYKNHSRDLKIEDFEGQSVVDKQVAYDIDIANILGENYCVVSDADYTKICSDYSLPVIARNNLENGQSKNLWYEQILPRESRLFFAVTQTPLSESNKVEAVKNFVSEFESPKQIQIGANATIGYGQCSISKLI